MDLNCILCLCETNINKRHHICSRCGKLICNSCLDNPKTTQIVNCPHCNHYDFFETNLLQLFLLLERENIDKNVVYNIIGCYLYLNKSEKQGIDFLIKSNTKLAKYNLDFINKINFDYDINYDKKGYDSILTYFNKNKIITVKFVNDYLDIFDSEKWKKYIKKLSYKPNEHLNKLCYKIVEKYKDDVFYKIILAVYKAYGLGTENNVDEAISILEEIIKTKEHSFLIYEAYSELGMIYFYKKNYSKAIEYFIKDTCGSTSLFFLSYIYSKGLGVEKDIKKSLIYFGKCLEEGYERCIVENFVINKYEDFLEAELNTHMRL